MATRWFAAKRYGYGWYPATKEGWIVILLYVLLLLGAMPVLAALGVEQESGLLFAILFLPYAALLTAALLWICVKKGEKPGWRWGG